LEAGNLKNRDLAEYALKLLKDSSADKAQVNLTQTKMRELNFEYGRISLLRSVDNVETSLTAIKNKKRASVSFDTLEKNTVSEAVRTLMEIVETSLFDPDNDIVNNPLTKDFSSKSEEVNTGQMYSYLNRFLREAKEKYPQVIISSAILDHSFNSSIFLNSNGLDLTDSNCRYNFSLTFSAKDIGSTSSFYFPSCSFSRLDQELIELADINTLLKQSEEHLQARSISEKFIGDVIITPRCLRDFLRFFTENYLSDPPLISGTSIFKDRLGEIIVSPSFSLCSDPYNSNLVQGQAFTPDGIETRNLKVIEEGVLKSFLLSFIGAKKTDNLPAPSNGGNLVVDPGSISLDEITGRTEKGILFCRYAGKYPDSRGDFSGIAKNSFLIEDGRIKHPLKETMVSGNLAELFSSIRAISRERINFGTSLLPWIASQGVTISGKTANN
jgi:PmbA protein